MPVREAMMRNKEKKNIGIQVFLVVYIPTSRATNEKDRLVHTYLMI